MHQRGRHVQRESCFFELGISGASSGFASTNPFAGCSPFSTLKRAISTVKTDRAVPPGSNLLNKTVWYHRLQKQGFRSRADWVFRAQKVGLNMVNPHGLVCCWLPNGIKRRNTHLSDCQADEEQYLKRSFPTDFCMGYDSKISCQLG